MGRRIDLPKTPSGEPEQQLQQLYSYLYQMAEALNNNLAEIGGSDLTDQERAEIREVIGTGDANEDRTEVETLKSLIIKTASFVQSSLNEYRTKLLGEYVAEGKFGKYVRRTGLDVDVTPSGITQNYTLQEIVQGLKTYEVNAKNYIKTGYLRTESSLPVYGVAIGKDVVTFSEDGTETYNDGNKVAELTADELSFWQNQQKIASYKGNRISFFYNGAEAFYISAGKIYCVNDLELSSGKKLIINTDNFSIDSSGNLVIKGTVQILNGKSLAIKTGGTFTIDSGNFSVDSSGNVALKGAAEILSGKSLKVKSGGSLQVESGGNIDINASGNLKLSGSTVEIKSGSTFDVDSENIMIDSSEGSFLTKSYISMLQDYLMFYVGNRLGAESNYEARISPVVNTYLLNNSSITTYPLKISIKDNVSNHGEEINSNLIFGQFYKRDIYDGEYRYLSGLELSATKKVNGLYESIYSHFTADIMTCSRYLWAEEISTPKGKILELTYRTMIQNSSKEIKHLIQPMEPVGEKLDRLQPVTFVYDDDPEEKVRAGLIYEDTVEVMPEICTGDESNKAISYMELVPMLLKEIQDLRARVKALEEREGGQ